MAHAQPALDEWLSTHRGVVSRDAWRALGVSDSTRYARIRRGELHRMMPGVFRSAAHADDRLSRMVAACLASPAVAIAGTSAGELWGMRNMIGASIHVLVPHGACVELGGCVVHTSRHIAGIDLAWRRPDGILLTSPPRTIIDAAPWIGATATEGVIEQALAERRCTLGTIVDTAARLLHPNHHGAAMVRALLAHRPKWRGAARSELELRLGRAIEAAGLPAPLVNHSIVVGGRRRVLDLAWPDVRLCVEVDHPYWHGREDDARRDRQRDRQLGAAGWFTARLSEWDIDLGLHEALGDLSRLLEVRRDDVA